jgi:flagellar hook-basal body complex protein FliE
MYCCRWANREQEAYRLQNQMQVNTRNLEDVFRANERSSSSLEIMQVCL